MAEALLRHMLAREKMNGIAVMSRGTSVWADQPMPPEALQALQSVGVRPAAHAAKQLRKTDIEMADVVLTMTENHRLSVLALAPEAKEKTYLLTAYPPTSLGDSPDIDDPIGGSPSDYEKCRIVIQNHLLDLLTVLKSQHERTKT